MDNAPLVTATPLFFFGTSDKGGFACLVVALALALIAWIGKPGHDARRDISNRLEG